MENITENKIRWYVMQVMSGQEYKVFDNISFLCSQDQANVVDSQQEAVADARKKVRPHSAQFNGLVNGIYELDIPYERVEEYNGEGKKVLRVRKLYPGYILIKVALYDGNEKLISDNWTFLRDTKGVIGLVGGQSPVPLSDEEVAEMTRRQAENEDGQSTQKVQYAVGDRVVFREGAFKNEEGTVEVVDNERGRLKVSVNVFGRATIVEGEFWQVTRL